jgi:hypothetical protein
MASTSAFVAALLQAVANASVNRLPASCRRGSVRRRTIRSRSNFSPCRTAFRCVAGCRLLAQTIGTAEVAQLLGARSLQTAHDRIKAGTLLAVHDQGHWRFPLWQFDPDGPDGVIDHLPEVVKALQVTDLARLQWLQRPQPVC